MNSPDALAGQVRSVGFACTGCSTCCQRSGTDSGLVMVTCGEIRAIMDATGLPWEEIAMPYPETVDTGNGGRFALGWCLRHEGEACRFLSDGRCTIYGSRPWICRTFPFMLDGETLVVSECEGTRRPVSKKEARAIASDLISRRSAEEEEALLVRDVLAKNPVPGNSRIVVDSEGVKVIHG